ncbi:glycosyltransferase [Enterovibrio baiacu]|uniref:glycosyltransferase n=1 Tax=Enterovibrio baiacu TaxID=2491023 RepID=UPI0013867D72|nr:glycosyltransferase [Enterovibrio baiacu]
MNSSFLSIVIPLAKGETQWVRLCEDFNVLPRNTEIILAVVEGEDITEPVRQFEVDFPHLKWVVLSSAQGRGVQMNKGARLAQGEYIWFLHADSRITRHNVYALLSCLNSKRTLATLFYFDLYFHDKRSKLLYINEIGAKFRSDVLGIPFGDQGFFLSKENFHDLGGYVEDAPYGEDHLLIWQAKRKAMSVRRCPSKLATSARKYERFGWQSLTLKYQYLWPKQAFPELIKLIQGK